MKPKLKAKKRKLFNRANLKALTAFNVIAKDKVKDHPSNKRKPKKKSTMKKRKYKGRRRRGKNYNKGYYKDYNEDEITDEDDYYEDEDGKRVKKKGKGKGKKGKDSVGDDGRPIKKVKKRPNSFIYQTNKFKMDKIYCKTVYNDEVVSKFTKYTTFDKLFGKKWAKAVNKMMIKRNKHVQLGNIL